MTDIDRNIRFMRTAGWILLSRERGTYIFQRGNETLRLSLRELREWILQDVPASTLF